MAYLNTNYSKLKAGYLFPEIARRVREYSAEHPEEAKAIIRCGIGDVTEPLPLSCRNAFHQAVDELGHRKTFRGYGPEQGYDFLRQPIAQHSYRDRGIDVDDDEIYVSDGSKCDTGNILDIFSADNRIAVMDPVYPVYVDTNVMMGNTGEADRHGRYDKLVYLPCDESNLFVPEIPDTHVDLIYLCSPNNPTGSTATRGQLQAWVDYARAHRAIIFFDAAYEAYIRDPDLPRSIYEIPGARECAIEFRSFSKNAGFTGVRCAFTVLPRTVVATGAHQHEHAVGPLWLRRHTTKFNGVSYPVQRAAAAVYSEAGQAETHRLVQYYLNNAKLLAEALTAAGWKVYGGQNAPYLWVKAPAGYGSWQVFDRLLDTIQVVVTPGVGFGAHGEGFFRVSAFNSAENAREASHRFRQLKW